MATYYYVAGPVEVYMRIPTVGAGPNQPIAGLAGTKIFLGYALEYPEPQFNAVYIPVKSSLAGPEVPDDMIYAGTVTDFKITLSKFSWTGLQLLQAWPDHLRAGGADPGTETYLDRGKLLQAQGRSFEIWTKNSFFGTANAVAYPDMPIGYYYPCCTMENIYPKKLMRDSTLASLSIKPWPVRIATKGGFVTYSQDSAYFANLPDPS